MDKRKIIIAVAVVALLGGSFAAMKTLAGMKEEPTKHAAKEVKRFVSVQPVAYQTLTTELKTSGRVVSGRFIDLSAEVSGKVLAGDVPIKKGQQFGKGDILARIYKREAELGLQSRKSRFMNSIANILPDFKIDYPNSYTEWHEFFNSISIEKPLPELPGASSDKEKIYLAGRNILSDYYTILSEQERLTKYTIRAPFTGTYTEVFLEPGSVANPGSRLGRIIRTDYHELEVPVSSSDEVWIKIGAKLKVVSGENNNSWTARVARKSKYIDAKTQALSVFIKLDPSRDAPIYQGQYLTAVFDNIEVEAAMQIPRKAVYNTNEVFYVEDNRLRKAEVKVLKINETDLIFNGLPEGTQLVVEPLVSAVENMKVYVR